MYSATEDQSERAEELALVAKLPQLEDRSDVLGRWYEERRGLADLFAVVVKAKPIGVEF